MNDNRMGPSKAMLLALGAFAGVIITDRLIHYLRTR